MRQVRYCGGPRDGQYQGWENDRGMPPEICTIESVLMSVADYDVDPTQPVALAYTQTRYQRVGYQDITGAELYATGEVITACRRGVPLSAQGIAPVRLGHEIVRLAGGPHHNERVTIGHPIPSLVDVPADIGRQWTPDAEIFPTEQTTRYYCLFQRDDAGILLYVSTELLRYIVRGVIPPMDDEGMLEAFIQAAMRFRSMNSLLDGLVLGEGVLLRGAAQRESPLMYEMAYTTDAQMSGKKEYPLDAVARENERRNAAMQKAQECIDSIMEVTDD